MKLVEILAEDMEECPKGVTHLTQSAVDREIYNAQDGKDTDSLESLEPRFDAIKSHDERGKYPVVTRAQWQAERDRQNGGEWKRHRGGKCPVPAGTKVSTRHRDGEVVDVHFQTAEYGTHKAVMDCVWKHDGSKHDIMAYKVISQPQAEEVEVKDTTIGTISYKISIDQIAGPLAWRDTIIHCQAIIEDCEREIERNTQQLAAEGFELIALINSNLDQIDAALESAIDMGDWRNWKRGDVIEMIADDWCDLSRDERYTIISTNDNSFTILDDCDDKRELSVDEEIVFSDGRIPDFKFIKRG